MLRGFFGNLIFAIIAQMLYVEIILNNKSSKAEKKKNQEKLKYILLKTTSSISNDTNHYSVFS